MFGAVDNPKVPFEQLGNIATYVNGYAFKPSDWGTEGLPIIRIQNLSGSGDSFNYYSGTYPPAIEINKGDIMISWSATLGVFVWDGPKALLNQHIFKVYFDKLEVNPTYFRVAVEPALERSASKVHGSTMTHLTKKTFDSIMVPLPSINQQNEFASFVHQVDKSKAIVQKCIDKYDLLVKSRFIELFDRYEKVPLTEMADITMGQSPNSSTYNDQGVGVPFFQGKSEFTDTFVQINKYCSEPKKMAKKMDILMSVRAPVGAVNLTNQECCIGRGLAAITPKDEITDVWFLFNALRIMEQQISDMGVGSTFTAISKDDMKKIRIPAAPLPIQIQFSNFVEQVDKSKFIETVEPDHPAVFQNVHGFPSFGLIST
ncbi:restriction endonuclease subunit S [Methanomethylophilus alvi]|uniref:restriction endonuclease subunit S n=1 Tax=Methanomethylophilus alvi TaxID=1291540 RepID=UPI0037DD927E